MNALNESSPAEEHDVTLQTVVNDTLENDVHGRESVETVLDKMKQKAEQEGASETVQSELKTYQGQMRSALTGSDVDGSLDENTGATYDGGKHTNTDVMKVNGGSASQATAVAAANVDFVNNAHEENHKIYGDEKPLKTVDGNLQLGGDVMDRTTATEGRNVDETGESAAGGTLTVSGAYSSFARRYRGALSRSGVSDAEARQAWMDRDLTKIDDRTRGQEVGLAA